MVKKVEFVISHDKLGTLQAQKGRVEDLFNVLVLLTNLVEGPHSSGQQWIQIQAREEDSPTDNAKEYILSLCDPQYEQEEKYPPELDGILRQCRNNIEKMSCASITFTDHFSVVIRGNDFRVMTACSLIEDIKTNGNREQYISNSNNQNLVTLWPKTPAGECPNLQKLSAEDCRSPGAGSKDSCYNSDDSDGGHPDFLKTQKYPDEHVKACIQRTCLDKKYNDFDRNTFLDQSVVPDVTTPPQSLKSPEDVEYFDISKHSAKVEYAAKLGYSEGQIVQVLRQLGPDVEQNDLLLALVKMDQKLEQDDTLIARSSHPPDIEAVCEQQIEDSSNLRAIIVDGSNVAMSHGNKKMFSCRGIAIVVDWFIEHGHEDIKVFVPQWRKEASKPDTPISDQDILNQLEKDDILVWTPSRRINGRRVVCYDDRYILKAAIDMDGIIVSNDNFRDLQNENPDWKRFIEERLLMYSFVNDTFYPPDDPLGRHGPSLDNFLRKNPTIPEPLAPPCPYGKKCTYGNKCKYYHSDRPQHQKSVSEKLQEQAKNRKELKARGDIRVSHESVGKTASSSSSDLKKAVSPQNSASIGDRRYTHLYKETNIPKPRQPMMADGSRPDEALQRQPMRYDQYMEPGPRPMMYTQRPPYIRDGSQYPYKAHTHPIQAYNRPPPPMAQQYPHTSDITGYRREAMMHSYMDPDLASDMRRMKIEEQSPYGYVEQGPMVPYARDGYRQHPPLSRQPSYHHPDMYHAPAHMHAGQDYIDHHQQQQPHANVQRLKSYPVEGPIPAIHEPRPNMIRQNSTSDPQLYQENQHALRARRTYHPDGEHNHWHEEQAYARPPARNGSEPSLWSIPQNQPMRAQVQAIQRPVNIEPPKNPNSTSTDIAFKEGDPRFHIFYNLTAVGFSNEQITSAMQRHPDEMDPQMIIQAIVNSN
ncbi:uncharacterized protein LOC144433463 isoform X1 [Glandiceps talaboti]